MGKKGKGESENVEYCPKCNSDEEFTPILYGYPSKEGEEMAKRGELLLGGCLFDESSPMHKCKKCGAVY
jgi:hypothetical protein